MTDLAAAPGLRNRMVLVKPDNTFKGVQPLTTRDGLWEGVVTAVKPLVKDDTVVDYALEIKLAFGTSRMEQSITLLFTNDRWRLRFA